MANQREKRQSLARRRAEPGPASEYINVFQVSPGDLFVIACRVSTHAQSLNLDDQEEFLREEIEDQGGIVIDIAREVAWGGEPLWLSEAVEIAKKTGATILAESTDRLIRHPSYHPKHNQSLMPRRSKLDKLRRATEGVTLMTVLNPEASSTKQRSHQTKRGQQIKANIGGRPKKKRTGHKKERREQLLPEALQLWSQGLSQRQVAKKFKVPFSTMQEWISKYGEKHKFITEKR